MIEFTKALTFGILLGISIFLFLALAASVIAEQNMMAALMRM